MKILICESEPALCKHVQTIIETLTHEIVGQAERLEEAYTSVMEHQPEVLFINAHLAYIEEFCQKLTHEFKHPPALIFFGLDEAHLMLTALKWGASDYLLIPIEKDDIKNALQKCCRINAAQQASLNKKNGKNSRARQYIAARTHRGVELISLSDVYYFTADQKYVKVRHKNGVVLIDETLKDLEEEFEGIMFRIHRNALINLDYLDLLETVDSGQYQVRFRGMPEKLSVSRRHLPMLREKIHSI
ncbi:LytR/AlgR family response regulator transcription factor [Moraxella bovis]|uniref:LytTR family DNA-binding domain-containing protein n=2 Tax=Moraxella bovis TaxID=476 RepID=A0A2Z4R752_MORBO|nr:LytTR family DNA-binding domain-containing protein [Moraxella bovis]AWY19451.1 DNA-binding response regulator [Moraxella bovis]UYZ68848.1 LytTR family DNA-binding domain-containing protein [Moraxella bovis]UYZ71224.1 LytTR family DNA-binding domain-containing protein [Moraxella bovis]UYZ72861.1 LytTR family DNA-binding domain-containing protein [Moraxella bovis]UYZ76166.1 LytTR family DNA-binding domain-containing protein [Moraxella bovis]